MLKLSWNNFNILKRKRYCLITGSIILNGFWLGAQTSSYNETLWVDSILQLARFNQELDAEIKSNLLDSAFQICERKKDICRQIDIRITQATHLDNMGLADSALTQLYWARGKFKPQCDSLLFLYLLSNLTNVFLSLNEFGRLDSIGQQALNYWNPNWKSNEIRRYAILTNLGISKAMQGEMDGATSIFRQAYREALAAGNKEYIQKELINLGTIKGMAEDLDSAYYYFNEAASHAKAQKDLENYLGIMINMADNERQRGNYRHGIQLLDSAYVLAENIKSTEHKANVYKHRADLYASSFNFEKAYQSLISYNELREQILNEEKIKSVTEMMEKYESEKKARQIQDLEIDKLDATLRNERVTNARNRFLIIGIIILLAAGGLWNRLRFVSRTRKEIQKEKDISEGLLLNILPGSVAEELKMKGFAEAKHFESATILFSDFKNFTTFASGMNAADLVEELNVCFKAFDAIMTKYGIEKIKTIGDAYMAAGGIPDTNRATVADVVNAGLDMQQFVKERKRERELTGLEGFEMRIGIHSGPVVAGIVGVKKFQYDLWGDTVNIASRMETNGKPGQVNISEATYKRIHQDPSFSFISRGMIHAKGKGQLAMYFVSHAKTAEAIIS